jgi:hypothetical protein
MTVSTKITYKDMPTTGLTGLGGDGGGSGWAGDNDIDDLIEEFSNEYEYPYKSMDYFDYFGPDEDSLSDQDDSNNEPDQDNSDNEPSDEDSSSDQDDPDNEQSGGEYDHDSSSDDNNSSSDDNDSSSDYDDFSGEFYDDINYYVHSNKYSNCKKPVTRSDTRNKLLKTSDISNKNYEKQPLRRSPRLNKNLKISLNDNNINDNNFNKKNIIINIKKVVFKNFNSKKNNTKLSDEFNDLSSQLKMLNI